MSHKRLNVVFLGHTRIQYVLEHAHCTCQHAMGIPGAQIFLLDDLACHLPLACNNFGESTILKIVRHAMVMQPAAWEIDYLRCSSSEIIQIL